MKRGPQTELVPFKGSKRALMLLDYGIDSIINFIMQNKEFFDDLKDLRNSELQNIMNEDGSRSEGGNRLWFQSELYEWMINEWKNGNHSKVQNIFKFDKALQAILGDRATAYSNCIARMIRKRLTYNPDTGALPHDCVQGDSSSIERFLSDNSNEDVYAHLCTCIFTLDIRGFKEHIENKRKIKQERFAQMRHISPLCPQMALEQARQTALNNGVIKNCAQRRTAYFEQSRTVYEQRRTAYFSQRRVANSAHTTGFVGCTAAAKHRLGYRFRKFEI